MSNSITTKQQTAVNIYSYESYRSEMIRKSQNTIDNVAFNTASPLYFSSATMRPSSALDSKRVIQSPRPIPSEKYFTMSIWDMGK